MTFDVSDTLLTTFINESLREIFHVVGDQAYFIRKTRSVTVSPAPGLTTLPSVIKRLYILEYQQYPGRTNDWTFVRHDDSGNMVISATEGGTFTAHYLEIPADLALPTDTTALPPHHIEVLTVTVCRRLAAAVGNAALLANYTEESNRLMAILKRDCLKYDGQRHGAMSVNSRSSWASGLTEGCFP